MNNCEAIGQVKSNAGKMFFLVCLILPLLSTLGCRSQPVYEANHRPTFSAKDVSFEEMDKAIREAGDILGWKFKAGGERELIGTLYLKIGRAVVSVTYTKTTYSIRYKDSLDLRYDENKGTIHGSYNQMVRRLDNAIRLKLKGLGA